MDTQNRVFVEAEFQQQPPPMAILGNMRHAPLAAAPRVDLREVLAAEHHLAGQSRRIDQAGKRLN